MEGLECNCHLGRNGYHPQCPQHGLLYEKVESEEVIGTTGDLIDFMEDHLSKDEWKALVLVHELTQRCEVALHFQWSKSIDVVSAIDSQIVDESVLYKNANG